MSDPKEEEHEVSQVRAEGDDRRAALRGDDRHLPEVQARDQTLADSLAGQIAALQQERDALKAQVQELEGRIANALL